MSNLTKNYLLILGLFCLSEDQYGVCIYSSHSWLNASVTLWCLAYGVIIQMESMYLSILTYSLPKCNPSITKVQLRRYEGKMGLG